MSSLSLLQESLSSMSWAPGVGTTLGGSLVKGATHANLTLTSLPHPGPSLVPAQVAGLQI